MSKKILQFCFKQNSKILKSITTKAVFYSNVLPILATAIPLVMIVFAIIISIAVSIISRDKGSHKPPSGANNETVKQQEQPKQQNAELEKKQQTSIPINEGNKNNTPIPINADNNNKTPEKNDTNNAQDIYNKQQKNIEQKNENESNKNNTPIQINADNNNKTPEKNDANNAQDIYNKQQKNIEQKVLTSLTSKEQNLKPV